MKDESRKAKGGRKEAGSVERERERRWCQPDLEAGGCKSGCREKVGVMSMGSRGRGNVSMDTWQISDAN